MAGTTRLELATSAVTVSGLQVLSTTWKSTDGTVSHWKYIIGNVIVYRDVYRRSQHQAPLLDAHLHAFSRTKVIAEKRIPILFSFSWLLPRRSLRAPQWIT
jgi:hypothetical protein